MITIHTSTHGNAPAVVRAIGRAVRPESIKPVIGGAVAKKFRTHLLAVNRAKPNALGGTRTNFYASAARSTHLDVVADGVMISVNSVGIRQRIIGGTIRPKTKKYLTLPAVAEAHGKRASEFDDLVVVFGARGQPIALAHALFRRTERQIGSVAIRHRIGTTRTGNRHGGIVFWLRKRIDQQGDPSVVPSGFEIAAAAISAVNAHVDRAVARASGEGKA